MQWMRNQRKSTRTGQLENKGSIFRCTIPFSHHEKFFASPIQGWLSSPSVSLPISIETFGWTETFLIPTKDFFFSSVPKLTFLRLGYFGNFFFSSDLERLENHKATCLRAFGDWFRGENGKLLFFRYRRGQFVFVDVFTSISLIVHSVFCKR